MTTIDNRLAVHLVKESFGEVAKSIVSLLLMKNGCLFVTITTELKLENKTVSQILSSLILHNLVEFELNTRQFVEYKFLTSNALNRLKIPRYMHLIKSRFDLNAVAIMEEMQLHGSLEMSSVLLKCMSRRILSETEPDASNNKTVNIKLLDSTYNTFHKSFAALVDAQFLERCPFVRKAENSANNGIGDTASFQSAKKSKVPDFSNNEYDTYVVPELVGIDVLRLKKSCDEDSETTACKMKKPSEDFGDNGIYWRLNERKCIKELRDQDLVKAIENKIEKNASNVARIVLQLANSHLIGDKATPNQHTSKSIVAIDIHKLMRSEYQMDSITVDKYLSVIAQDSSKFLDKIGDFSGGAYCVDFKKVTYNLCLAHVESYVRERYNSKSLRIFKVVLEKVQLEHKQIEDFSMIPAKDCKELIYKMLNDGIFKITELSKTSDHAPSRTYYLFTVDIDQICRKLLENSYKAVMNLMLKREHLNTENKRLLEKQLKVKTIIESLTAHGAEEAEIEEVKLMMSEEELRQLKYVTEHCNRLELAEIQLAETIFIFEIFFFYNTLVPVTQPAKKR